MKRARKAKRWNNCFLFLSSIRTPSGETTGSDEAPAGSEHDEDGSKGKGIAFTSCRYSA